MMKPEFIDPTRGPYVRTYSGEAFYFTTAKPCEIDIDHIAWSLSMQSRFGGSLHYSYNVAQHSLVVASIVESETPNDHQMILKALLHDAPEAYLTDMPTPVKRMLPQYYEMEKYLDDAIATKFNIPFGMPDIVHRADMVALCTEAQQMHPHFFLGPEFDQYPRLDFDIETMTQPQAYKAFLKKFKELQG